MAGDKKNMGKGGKGGHKGPKFRDLERGARPGSSRNGGSAFGGGSGRGGRPGTRGRHNNKDAGDEWYSSPADYGFSSSFPKDGGKAGKGKGKEKGRKGQSAKSSDLTRRADSMAVPGGLKVNPKLKKGKGKDDVEKIIKRLSKEAEQKKQIRKKRMEMRERGEGIDRLPPAWDNELEENFDVPADMYNAGVGLRGSLEKEKDKPFERPRGKGGRRVEYTDLDDSFDNDFTLPEDSGKRSPRNHGQVLSSFGDGEGGWDWTNPDPKAYYESMKSKKSDKAKRMVLRKSNKKIEKRNQDLREKRIEGEALGEMRLQKILAASGLGSRREMDELIANGRVEVNGKVATPGQKIVHGDVVKVNKRNVDLAWPDRLPRIVIYNKQEQEIVTRSDPEGRRTVFERIPLLRDEKWVACGRLDYNTSGLLIFTTSGELANRFTHPRYGIDREYMVRVSEKLSDEDLKMLTRDGVPLDDGVAKAAYVSEEGSTDNNFWYRIIVQEGRYHEVRRIFESLGRPVTKLRRTRFGPIGIPPRLKPGFYYELNPVEVDWVLGEMGMNFNKAVKESKRFKKR